MAIRLDSVFKALSAHKVIVTVSTRNDIDLREDWIINNCEGKYYVSAFMYRKQSKTVGIFYLWDDIDAMEFKLRWG